MLSRRLFVGSAAVLVLGVRNARANEAGNVSVAMAVLHAQTSWANNSSFLTAFSTNPEERPGGFLRADTLASTMSALSPLAQIGLVSTDALVTPSGPAASFPVRNRKIYNAADEPSPASSGIWSSVTPVLDGNGGIRLDFDFKEILLETPWTPGAGKPNLTTYTASGHCHMALGSMLVALAIPDRPSAPTPEARHVMVALTVSKA